MFGYWLVHHGLQLGSSGEIEDKDLSRAVGLKRQLGIGVNRGAIAISQSIVIEHNRPRAT